VIEPVCSLRALVTDALDCLAREHPEAHQRMCARLGARSVAIELGDERFALAGGPDAVAISAWPDDAALTVRTDAATLDDLLCGELTVVGALTSDRLEVRGAIDDLVAAFDAAAGFLRGAVRCTSMPALLDQLSHHARVQR